MAFDRLKGVYVIGAALVPLLFGGMAGCGSSNAERLEDKVCFELEEETSIYGNGDDYLKSKEGFQFSTWESDERGSRRYSFRINIGLEAEVELRIENYQASVFISDDNYDNLPRRMFIYEEGTGLTINLERNKDKIIYKGTDAETAGKLFEHFTNEFVKFKERYDIDQKVSDYEKKGIDLKKLGVE